MRVLVMVKADEDFETGTPVSEELFAAMTKYNEELARAGVLLAFDGLRPSSHGVRLRFERGGRRSVVDGPFSETKELVAGYWLWQVASIDEAIEWAKRCPGSDDDEGVIEIRPVTEYDDFGDALAPEIRERWERLDEQVSGL